MKNDSQTNDMLMTRKSRIHWAVAEGAALWSLNTWIFIINVNERTAVCEVVFMKSEKRIAALKFRVAPGTRLNFHINDFVPYEAVATTVASTNGVPIIVDWATHCSDYQVKSTRED